MNLDNVSENHIPDGLGSALPLHKIQKRTDDLTAEKQATATNATKIDKADMSTLSRIMAKGADTLENILSPRAEVVKRFKNIPDSSVAFPNSTVERIFKKMVD
jgi:hypothetical protein